jgi:hypothetical protein
MTVVVVEAESGQNDEQARLVQLAKQRARLREQSWWRRPWGWLQDVLSGYGYAPGRAACRLAAAFTLGWWYSVRHPSAAVKGGHPSFNAALYTLDLLLPRPTSARRTPSAHCTSGWP